MHRPSRIAILGAGLLGLAGLLSGSRAAHAGPAPRGPSPCPPRWELRCDPITLGLGVGRAATDRWQADFDRGGWHGAGWEGEFASGFLVQHGAWRARLGWRARGSEGGTLYGRLLEGWVGFRQGPLRARLGRGSCCWAPAAEAALLLSAHAPPLDHLLLGLDDLSLPAGLGQGAGEMLLACLDDPDRAVPNPLLWGMRAAWQPRAGLWLEAQRTIMLGGAGRTRRLTLDDLWEIFLGRGEGTAAAGLGPDFYPVRESDQKFAWVVRVQPTRATCRRLGVRALEGFWIYAGEDRFSGLAPMSPGRAWGLWLQPAARLALAFVYANTAPERNIWYRHKIYLKGYTYRGYLLGHPMGPDAKTWRWTLVWMTPQRCELTGRLWREERGYYSLERGILPGGYWSWSLQGRAPWPHGTLTFTLGASHAWGGDQAAARPAEGFARLEVAFGGRVERATLDRGEGWGVRCRNSLLLQGP